MFGTCAGLILLAKQLFEQQKLRYIPIPGDESGLVVDRLETEQIDAVYVTPAHQFPTGTILSVSRRQRLLNWASDRQTYIIEDDYDSEFRYSGKPIPSLQSMDQNERVIYLSTFSKSLMPSLRIGYMVLPPKLLNRYRARYRHFTCSVPRFEQHTLAEFMACGDFEKHLNRMRKTYRRKLEIVVSAFKPYESAITVSGTSAGLHVILTVKTAHSNETLRRQAEAASIRMKAMDEYAIHRQDLTRQFLFGFAAISEDVLPIVIDRLMSCWNIPKGGTSGG